MYQYFIIDCKQLLENTIDFIGTYKYYERFQNCYQFPLLYFQVLLKLKKLIPDKHDFLKRTIALNQQIEFISSIFFTFIDRVDLSIFIFIFCFVKKNLLRQIVIIQQVHLFCLMSYRIYIEHML